MERSYYGMLPPGVFIPWRQRRPLSTILQVGCGN